MIPVMSSLAEVEIAVESLSVEDQEQLLETLVARLRSGTEEEFPVREDHLRLLEERFAAYRLDPTQASTWEEVKRRFEKRTT